MITKSEPYQNCAQIRLSTDSTIQLHQTKNFENVNTKHYPPLLLFTAHIKMLVPSADHHYPCLSGQRQQRPFLEVLETNQQIIILPIVHYGGHEYHDCW